MEVHFPRQDTVPRTVISLPTPSKRIIRSVDGVFVHAIDTVEDLRAHLQTAIALEWGTIPLYLFGRYSLVPGDYPGLGPARLIHSVVQEEMLHLVLAGNMLKAIGGTPLLYSAQPFPIFPVKMPGHSGNFILPLYPADYEQLQIYAAVEKPADSGAPPQPDNYDTIGQFYGAIIESFRQLGNGIFDKSSVDYQIFGPDGVYAGNETGGLTLVTDVNSAVDAATIIVEQGEGNKQTDFDDPSDTDVAHYFRFQAIIQQSLTNPGKTINVWPNPLTEELPSASPEYAVSRLFDACYCFLLLAIEGTYAISKKTDPAKRAATTAIYVEFMTNVVRRIAVFLVQQDSPALDQKGYKCAPAFNLYDFYKEGGQTPPLAQIKNLLQVVYSRYPAGVSPLLAPLQEILESFQDLDPAPKLVPYVFPA
ncbi:hypothetical protein DACRYDRAFT_114419 [Dacryopinax primogenitus]|uniref:Iminophenyl-pyruvate dimer synthase domain-containing protein n=1 Tax=Dacryopinax primogenitus (strain DJM 731) TaxID=1858805 RepID=M5G6Y1_DACPD|nr:uncharacterized protein DACRYDRAFT_114419 [Dacryopinax primogenitus]EJU03970.1 hypothetical protein DACRYDRAFT_114419 [Dacryopinax primogenitus]